mmetsp:Transcript_51062/g.148635  ORF Transcript_51062/g.148635 Transcript_51062/m.148635 type:complete len:257 (-) Transcript_51062:1244-2014(-)
MEQLLSLTGVKVATTTTSCGKYNLQGSCHFNSAFRRQPASKHAAKGTRASAPRIAGGPVGPKALFGAQYKDMSKPRNSPRPRRPSSTDKGATTLANREAVSASQAQPPRGAQSAPGADKRSHTLKRHASFGIPIALMSPAVQRSVKVPGDSTVLLPGPVVMLQCGTPNGFNHSIDAWNSVYVGPFSAGRLPLAGVSKSLKTRPPPRSRSFNEGTCKILPPVASMASTTICTATRCHRSRKATSLAGSKAAQGKAIT